MIIRFKGKVLPVDAIEKLTIQESNELRNRPDYQNALSLRSDNQEGGMESWADEHQNLDDQLDDMDVAEGAEEGQQVNSRDAYTLQPEHDMRGYRKGKFRTKTDKTSNIVWNKGGEGSGNFGHSGDSPNVGGSGPVWNIGDKLRSKNTGKMFTIAQISHTAAGKRLYIDASDIRIPQFNEGNWEKVGGIATTNDSNLIKDKWDDIHLDTTSNMKAYFIRKDGKLVDVNNTALEHEQTISDTPELLGLSTDSVKGLSTESLFDKATSAGNYRVRLGMGKHEVSIDNLPINNVGLKKIQNWLGTQIPSGMNWKYYWTDSVNGDFAGIQRASYEDIANAKRIVNGELKEYDVARFVIKGGEGSGNFSHAGRPGEVGGSAEEVGGSAEASGESSKMADPNGTDTLSQYMRPDGTWTPERQALHDKIIKEYFQGKTPVNKPQAIVMGGGPAVGKTTLIKSGAVPFPDGFEENHVVCAPDDVKLELPEYDSKGAPYVHEESSYIGKEIMEQAAEGSYNLLYDGTGDTSVDSMSKKINMLKDAGEEVTGLYATVPIDVALARSAARCAKTGRFMPPSVLTSGHKGVSTVFPGLAKSGVFDHLYLYDTSGKTPNLLFKDTSVVDSEEYQKFLDKAK